MPNSSNDSMTLASAISYGQDKLKSIGIDSARLDVLILLEHITNLDRAKILVDDQIVLKPSEQKLYIKLVGKRSLHMPIAQLTNIVEFYGHEFKINNNVLIPRPETEDIVTLLIQIIKNDPDLSQIYSDNKPTKPINVVDLGTGSGAIGISAKLALPRLKVTLIDDDSNALEIAKMNVAKFTLDINIINDDLLSKADYPIEIILANLPYVPDSISINEAAKFEPGHAIFGGEDGLDLYKKMFKQIQKNKNKPLYLLLESLVISHLHLTDLAVKYGYKLTKNTGLVNVYKYDR